MCGEREREICDSTMNKMLCTSVVLNETDYHCFSKSQRQHSCSIYRDEGRTVPHLYLSAYETSVEYQYEIHPLAGGGRGQAPCLTVTVVCGLLEAVCDRVWS